MSYYSTRRQFLGVAGSAGIVGLAGCTDALTRGGDKPEPEGEPDVQAERRDVELSYDIEKLNRNVVSGGVPKDGIPSVDDPSFGDVSDGDENLDPEDPVFGLDVDGLARAYPQYILVRHEIVNDVVGDQGIAVTYCPLTGTALGFVRDVGEGSDGRDEFGVSGRLVNSNLIMYDRSSETWWSQILGTAIRGDESEDVVGRSLQEVRLIWTTWGNWKARHPDTEVLTEDTGEAFSYTRDPYGQYNPIGGYYENRRIMFDPVHEDDTYHPKEVFMGARTEDGKVAFQKHRLREDHLLETTLDDIPYLAAYHHDLDSAWVYRNSDDEQFTATDEGYEGPGGQVYAADELPLESVHTFDAMWFAWYGFYPETEVVA